MVGTLFNKGLTDFSTKLLPHHCDSIASIGYMGKLLLKPVWNYYFYCSNSHGYVGKPYACTK